MPARGRADRPHDPLLEHLGQRAAEPAQQRQAQPVDADIVVFPVAAGRLQRARLPLALPAARLDGEAAVAVDAIGLAEQRALPLRGLLQQWRQVMAPLRALEAAVAHAPPDRLIEIGDQPVGQREPGDMLR